MTGWGARMVGYATVSELLETLTMNFSGDIVYVCGPTVNYAVYHELGTSKMEARPFARPAAENVQANLDSAVNEFLEVPILEASEAAIVQSVALAVEQEMKRIVRKKDIWDTGDLHGSITHERVA